jgi:hypothetical protein
VTIGRARALHHSRRWIEHHTSSQGRSPSRNAGAHAASAPIMLFLDGDVLVRRGTLRAHVGAHGAGSVVARGETFHLRCTRFLLDPERTAQIEGEGSASRYHRFEDGANLRAVVAGPYRRGRCELP